MSNVPAVVFDALRSGMRSSANSPDVILDAARLGIRSVSNSPEVILLAASSGMLLAASVRVSLMSDFESEYSPAIGYRCAACADVQPVDVRVSARAASLLVVAYDVRAAVDLYHLAVRCGTRIGYAPDDRMIRA